jgi:dTDP-L-rhamnose 4-epimerase
MGNGFRAGDIRHCVVDTSRARARSGWQAERRLEDGLRELIHWAAGEQPEDRTDRANAELRALRLIEAADVPHRAHPHVTPS